MTDIATPRELLQALGDGERYVYQVKDSYRWRITRGGDVRPELVMALIDGGALRPVYSNCPSALWPGRTIDVDASLALRKRTGNKAAVIYAA